MIAFQQCRFLNTEVVWSLSTFSGSSRLSCPSTGICLLDCFFAVFGRIDGTKRDWSWIAWDAEESGQLLFAVTFLWKYLSVWTQSDVIT